MVETITACLEIQNQPNWMKACSWLIRLYIVYYMTMWIYFQFVDKLKKTALGTDSERKRSVSWGDSKMSPQIRGSNSVTVEEWWNPGPLCSVEQRFWQVNVPPTGAVSSYCFPQSRNMVDLNHDEWLCHGAYELANVHQRLKQQDCDWKYLIY